jgi:hypothetical protein
VAHTWAACQEAGTAFPGPGPSLSEKQRCPGASGGESRTGGWELPGVVVPACNPSPGGVEAVGSQVPDQPEPPNTTVSKYKEKGPERGSGRGESACLALGSIAKNLDPLARQQKKSLPLTLLQAGRPRSLPAWPGSSEGRLSCHVSSPGIFLYGPGWPGTHSPPASAFPVLGLQACTTTPAKHGLLLLCFDAPKSSPSSRFQLDWGDRPPQVLRPWTPGVAVQPPWVGPPPPSPL